MRRWPQPKPPMLRIAAAMRWAQLPRRVALAVNCQGVPADPPVVAAVRQAGAWLADAGYAVEEVEPPSLAEAQQLWTQVGNDEARQFMWPAVQKLGDEGVRRSFGWMLDESPLLTMPRICALCPARHAAAPLAAVHGDLPAAAVPGVRRAAFPLGLGRAGPGHHAACRPRAGIAVRGAGAGPAGGIGAHRPGRCAADGCS